MSSQQSKSFIEHNRQQQERTDKWQRNDDVREAIRLTSRALQRGQRKHYHYIAKQLNQTLIPRLLTEQDYSPEDYDDKLSDDPTWAFDSLTRYISQSAVFEAAVQENSPPGVPSESVARDVIADALRSCTVIAEHEGIIRNEMSNTATATGYALRTGTLHKKYEHNYDPRVQTVSRESGLTKSIFVGETGEGKSTSMDTEVEDRFNAGFKIIDLLDTDELESGVYDIPQKQEVLREVREEAGLPADFTDSDELQAPDIEILVPMTPALDGEKMPYDTAADEWVPKRFTIPAADLSKRALLSFLKSVVTSQQEVAIGNAYEDVRDDLHDWTLRDLANRVDRQQGLADNFKHRVRKLLVNLQRKGFIRDRECPHALDWERIFRDDDTITVFTTAPMRERQDKLMVISYLTRAIYHKRKNYEDLPDCAGVFRELHEVAGHQNVRSDDAREKAIQKAFRTEFSYILRKNRHEDLELLVDTQDYLDIDNSVRKRFNRAVAFESSSNVVEDLFDQVAGNKWMHKKYGRNVSQNFDKATGTVFGKNGTEQPFLTPVEFVPPSWHNFDNEEDDTGWQTRVKHLDNEEFRPIDWDTRLPGRLEIHVDDTPSDSGDDSEEKPEQAAIEAFAESCLVHEPDAAVPTHRVRDAYRSFADEADLVEFDTSESFGIWFGRNVDCENDRIGDTQHYVGIELSPEGQSYLRDAE